MDCQGSKDLKRSTPTLDNLIMFLGLQLSDIHILNTKGTIGADDFERLGVSEFLNVQLNLILTKIMKTALLNFKQKPDGE